MGGKNAVPMAQLRELFAGAGASDVATYIQSGNVVFTAPASRVRSICDAVVAEMDDALGFTVPIVSRTAAALQAAVDGSPFTAEGADPTKMHVGFLAAKPTKAAVAGLDPDRSPPDRFAVIGQEIHLLCPKGMARTKLTSTYLDRQLGTTVTVRNWKTTNKLLELATG